MSTTDVTYRVLLLQVRERDEVAQHEKCCVCERAGLEPGEVDSINLVEHSEIPWERVERAGAVVIGGAGVHSATSDDPFTPALLGAIRDMVEAGVPLFGTCYGHQIIARALGGRVIKDVERAEIGAHSISLTSEGARDPLLRGLADPMPVLMGHQDRVSELPLGAVELAESDTCPNQAFRIDGAPVYCTQFHTELSPTRILERLELYRHIYMPDDDEFETMKRSLVPTPDAEMILRRFLDRFARA